MSKLRIVPLGGTSHVTKNFFVYEYWFDNGKVERLIVDCGIGFPEEEMMGVDLILPDISYLKGKEDTILGIVLTHGHDDHIGGLPYLLPKLGKIPLYASPLTAGLIKNKFKEFKLNNEINVLNDSVLQKIGSFEFEFICMTHSIPDTKHIIIRTPIGNFYHGADFKLDFTPVDGKKPDLQRIALAGKEGILCMLSDCLRVEKEGFTPSETLLEDTFEREIRSCQGKFIVTTMSSNIHRIQQAVNVAARHKRKVAFFGRSIESNTKVAQELGFFKMPPGVYATKRQSNKIPPKDICFIVAGSQGQEDSALVRIANDAHLQVKITPGDKVVFSVDPIPGNENAFYRTIDKLSQLGAIVSYSDILDDLHVSGHASAGELKIVLSLVKPKYVMPIGGNFRHMNHFRNLASSIGFDKKNVLILKEGQIISFDNSGNIHYEEILDLKTVVVDGLGVGDVGRIVLSDRKQMSKEGIVVVAIPVKKGTNQVISDPEIISRGFVFMRDSNELIRQAKKIIKNKIPSENKIDDWQKLKVSIEKELKKFFFNETAREPIILPVIVKV